MVGETLNCNGIKMTVVERESVRCERQEETDDKKYADVAA